MKKQHRAVSPLKGGSWRKDCKEVLTHKLVRKEEKIRDSSKLLLDWLTWVLLTILENNYLTTVNSFSLFAVRGNRTLTILAFRECRSANHSTCSISFAWWVGMWEWWPVVGESLSSDSIGDGEEDSRVPLLLLWWWLFLLLCVLGLAWGEACIMWWEWIMSSASELSASWTWDLRIGVWTASSRTTCTEIGIDSSSISEFSDDDANPINSGSVMVGAHPSVNTGWNEIGRTRDGCKTCCYFGKRNKKKFCIRIYNLDHGKVISLPWPVVSNWHREIATDQIPCSCNN